jgi:choline dehydrogenase-like flavoprotein
MGSCRMGPRDDGNSVVDRDGRLWRYDNVYVAGNAVLAQSNAGNPTLTTIAAALRTADAIVENKVSSAVSDLGQNRTLNWRGFDVRFAPETARSRI